MSAAEYWLDASWQLLLRSVDRWIRAWLRFDWETRDQEWINVKLYISTIAGLIAENARDAVKVAQGWIDTAISTVNTVIDAVRVTADAAWGWVYGNGDITWDWISTKASDVWNWINTKADDVWDWIDTKADDVWDWIDAKASDVWDWINTKSDDVWDWINTKASDVWNWIDTKADDVWEWISGAGASLKAWWDLVHVALSTLVNEYMNALIWFLDDPGRYIADWVVDTLEYIVSECVFRFWGTSTPPKPK